MPRHKGGTYRRSHKEDTVWNARSGMRDAGQRYVVRYTDGMGDRRSFGFTDNYAEALKWALQIRANPAWRKPKIFDRQEHARKPIAPTRQAGAEVGSGTPLEAS